MHASIETLIDRNSNLKVRLLPVAIINQQSLISASAVIAAMKYPGDFQLFNQMAWSQPNFSPDSALFKRLGLSESKFRQDMHSFFVQQQLREALVVLQASQRDAVPLIIISKGSDMQQGSRIFSGEVSLNILQEAIDDAQRIQ